MYISIWLLTLAIGLLTTPLPNNDDRFSHLIKHLGQHSYPDHFYQVTLKDPAFLDYTIDTGEYKQNLKDVIQWQLAETNWIKQSFSHPQFIDWTSASPTGHFALGLDDFKSLVLEEMIFYEDQGQLTRFITDLVLDHIPLMGLATDLTSVVNLIAAFHQNVATDSPSLQTISDKIHSSWAKEKVSSLLSELFGTNYIALFESLALNDGSNVEELLRDWIYSPSR